MDISGNISNHGGKRTSRLPKRPRLTETPVDIRDRYALAKAEREEHQARLAELEVAEREGKLVSWEIVARDQTRAGLATRDAILSVPGRIASQLAGMEDEREIERVITAALRAELQRIAQNTGQ